MSKFLLTAFISLASFAATASPKEGAVIATSDKTTIRIEEFSDFECQFCAQGSKVMAQLLKMYPGKIELVLRQMPLSKIHPIAHKASQAFLAVYIQKPESAYAYQETLFSNQGLLSKTGEPYLYEVALRLGVDIERMKRDMNSQKVEEWIAHDQSLASKNGFRGTPSFVIGNEKIQGVRPIEEFKQIIDRQ